MKFGIVIFPGSNCDQDCHFALQEVLGEAAVSIWHETQKLPSVDAVILPGGFSYGDYLRAGAIAARSPVMGALRGFAESGGLVIGICNGFQILCEAEMLPGVLLRNNGVAFRCEKAFLSVERDDTPFTHLFSKGCRVQMPIAHASGNYFAHSSILSQVEEKRQVVFRYESDLNGSINQIAGICNEQGNVLGLMPHPERAVATWMGSVDGAKLFLSMAGK